MTENCYFLRHPRRPHSQANIPKLTQSRKTYKPKPEEKPLMVSDTKECIFCHRDSDSEEDMMDSPCDCKGSMSRVHRHCLEKWINLSSYTFCTICGKSIKVIRTRKVSLREFLTKMPSNLVSFVTVALTLSVVIALSDKVGRQLELWSWGSRIQIWFMASFTMVLLYALLKVLAVWYSDGRMTYKIDRDGRT